MGKEPVCWPLFQQRSLMNVPPVAVSPVAVSPVAVLCLHHLSALAE